MMRRTKRNVTKACIAFAAAVSLLAGSQAAYSAQKNYAYMDNSAGVTYVPLRLLGDYAGAVTEWHKEDERIVLRKAGRTVTLYLGKKAATVDEAELTLENPPFMDGGVTYVPLKFAGQALGISIEWQPKTRSVQVKTEDRIARLPVIPRGSMNIADPAVVHEERTFRVDKRSFSVHLVTVSLMNPRVELDVALAGGKIGEVEELASIAKREGAAVAVNGTFFDAYTESPVKRPYGYILNGGELLYKASGDLRSVFAFDANHLTEIIDGADLPGRIEAGDIDGAIQAGPRLVRDGEIKLDVEAEGFKDPKILTGGGARSALGITKDHKLLLLTTGGATIPQLASIMKQAGAYQAMNLDGGASSGLYLNGKYLTKPGRKISNALIVKLES